MDGDLRRVGPRIAARLDGGLIGGEIRRTGELFEITPPFEPAERAQVHAVTEAEMEEAVAGAVDGAQLMAAMPLHERVAIIDRLAVLVEEHHAELAATMTWQTGKPIRETRREATRSAGTLRLAGRSADLLRGRQVLTDTAAGGAPLWAFTHRRPLGVIAAIPPSNAPLNLLAHKLGPGLVAGNAVVVKPAPQTTVVSLLLAELALEAGAPATAVQVLAGGAEPALFLARDARVKGLTFTGGAVAGESLWKAAPFKRLIMELGGNSANLVLHDADVPSAAEHCFRGAFSNSGQSCNSVQRLIVHRNVVEEFIECLAGHIATLVVGDPFDEATDIAGMSSSDAAERVEGWITSAVSGGARLVAGGRREEATIWPTLLDRVTSDMQVACEEIFGPVAVILRADDDADALRIANATDYGLQFGVFTRSLDAALTCSEALEAGSVIVNRSSNFRLDSFVYGGVKASGVGREDPSSTVLAMSEEHFVVLGDRGPMRSRLEGA